MSPALPGLISLILPPRSRLLSVLLAECRAGIVAEFRFSLKGKPELSQQQPFPGAPCRGRIALMSRAAASKPLVSSPPLRPTLVDYLFLLAGASLSLYLVQIGSLMAVPGDGAATATSALLAFLPGALRVSEGMILLWPLFFVTQRLRGRKESLTAVEWLWVLSWIGIAVLTLMAALETTGNLPDSLQKYAATPRKLWYYIFAPVMAGLAVLLGVGGLLRRGPAPWTHSFGIALMLWPVVPLAGILALGASLK
jgi:hypothetical protein